MEASATLAASEMEQVIGSRDPVLFRRLCASAHPAGIAEVLRGLNDPHEVWDLLQHAPVEPRAEIFSHLPEDTQLEIMEALPRLAIAGLMTEMSPDDRADLFKQLPESVQEAILPSMAQAEREDIRRLASYEEGTVGAVMTSDYATLEPVFTVKQAIEHLRQAAPDRETIYNAYVVDKERKLVGFVTLKNLILAQPNELISSIMQCDYIYASVDEDQETAARRLQKYDLIAMPVVDQNETLVGIITHDDAFDVLVQEQQEDLEKLFAIGGSHEAGIYLRKSPWEHFRGRVLWVIGLAGLGLVSGQIVKNATEFLVAIPILTVFMPMLAATGGNTGSQSTTLVIRALAMQEIRPKDILRVLWKELRVGLLLSAILGLTAYSRVMLQSAGRGLPADGPSLLLIGAAIALALGLQVVSSTLLGAFLPIVAARLKVDPAVVASPSLTTIVDITGLLIYFGVAGAMLGGFVA
ncbi:MAG: magnesium transporter [Kiritimatiellia bacterium]